MIDLGTCIGGVVDEQKRARICGKPATAIRIIDGHAFTFCADCAAKADAERTKGGAS